MDTVETFEAKINRSDYKVLIVDDVVSNVLLLKILLTNEKFQVCTASNGKDCIEISRKEHPDLILLDVMMPDLNGFDTAVILKKGEDTKDIPIITGQERCNLMHQRFLTGRRFIRETGNKLFEEKVAAVHLTFLAGKKEGCDCEHGINLYAPHEHVYRVEEFCE